MKMWISYLTSYDTPQTTIHAVFTTEEKAHKDREANGRWRRNKELKKRGLPEDLPFGDPSFMWGFDERAATQMDAFYGLKSIEDWSYLVIEEVEVDPTVTPELGDD